MLTQAISPFTSSSSLAPALRASGSGGVLSGGGGVGKSQLAAAYAAEAIRGGTELVVWAHASAPDGLITTYAQAAARVQAAGATGQPSDVEADALAFLEWAATTSRSWLVVLDDITDPDTAAALWPASHTGTGWVLATTRRRDEVLFGAGRRRVDVDVYERDEATAYLEARLKGAGKTHLLDHQADELADALGCLPLALSHAVAYMITQRVACGDYLDLYTAGAEKLDEIMPGDPDGHARLPDGTTRAITVTLLLALDAADGKAPVGLARPAMELVSVLDPAGHPETLWATDAAHHYLATHRTATNGGAASEPSSHPTVTPRQARDALLLLDRYGLTTLDEQAGHRAVRVHALTARATHETAPVEQAVAAVLAAADALLELWPDAHYYHSELITVLRANTTTLARHDARAGNILWAVEDGAHPLLWQAGLSLAHAGLHNPAITYWRQTSATALRVLGPEHPETLSTQANLAVLYRLAGRTDKAISIEEKVVADRVRILGPEHPETLTAQVNLAASYWQAGRTDKAISIEEKVVADRVRILGPEHPETLTAQANLAASYAQAGRTDEAISILEKVVADRVRILGPEHPDTRAVVAALQRWKNEY